MLSPQDDGGGCVAVEGNTLEAINLAANLLALHYVDRRMDRTGQQITVFTAGQVRMMRPNGGRGRGMGRKQ